MATTPTQQALALVPALLHASVQYQTGVAVADTSGVEIGKAIVDEVRRSFTTAVEGVVGPTAVWVVAIGAASLFSDVCAEAGIDPAERLEVLMSTIAALDPSSYDGP